ncbi:MAG: beta-lactamase family protein [Saprospiraceae bacterium]|nr:beta-lactamase family protein [Saprospiraceae bacterium]
MRNLLIFMLFLQQLAIAQDFNFILNAYPDFDGVVGVSTGNNIDFIGAKGIADRQHNVKITPQTKFKICSITKTFTAVLVLQLVEQGKLDLNATIGKYLPWYTGEGRDKVTLHHLLTYSSGIPNCEGDLGLGVYQREISTDDFIKTYCSGKLATEPGSQFNYDNGAYIILGRIIEVVTGKSYQENLHEKILRPTALINTDFLSDFQIVEGLASSYWMDDSTKVLKNDPAYFTQNYGAAAAMYSTVEDLLKLNEALFSGKLLQKKTLDLMLTPYPELYGVAYGFWVYDLEINEKKYRAADRQGSIWGSNAAWLHLIEEQKTVIILSNTNVSDLGEIRNKLLGVSLKKK